MTTPDHIPYLIDQIDKPGYWWVDELLRSWFPVPSESYLEQAPDVSKRVFWSTWWENNKRTCQTLKLHYDPQF